MAKIIAENKFLAQRLARWTPAFAHDRKQMIEGLGSKHTQLAPGFGAEANIRLAIQREGRGSAFHPTEISAVKAQAVAHNTFRQRTRDNLLGLKLLFPPKSGDVPELERLDLVSCGHFQVPFNVLAMSRAVV